MTDVNDVRPSSIKHLIGQQSVIQQVQVALDAAFQDGTKFPSAALTGGPGLGKTQLSHVIAQEMGGEFIEVLGQSITSAAELNGLLLSAPDRSVVFVDEAAELDKTLQVSLYLALDQRKVILTGTRKASAPVSVPLNDFTLLLATTDEFQLLQPLRDRMRLLLRFQPYSDDELVQILWLRLRALGWPVEEAVLPSVARRSRGTPRLALRLAQAARRVARSEGDTTITLDHLERACLLEGTDDLGLGPVEQNYLRVLLDGATRLNVIASRLGLPARTVAEVTEPFLIRAGLVEKDDQSRRHLTALARERLAATDRAQK